MMESTQVEIRAIFDNQNDAIANKDIDRLISLYSTDILYFDVVPPLRFEGSAALRRRFAQWFDAYEGSLRVETRDVEIRASGDMAFIHWLSRVSGMLKNGKEGGFWVRATSCYERSNERWMIVHEHISLPVDVMSEKAATDLAP